MEIDVIVEGKKFVASKLPEKGPNTFCNKQQHKSDIEANYNTTGLGNAQSNKIRARVIRVELIDPQCKGDTQPND